MAGLYPCERWEIVDKIESLKSSHRRRRRSDDVVSKACNKVSFTIGSNGSAVVVASVAVLVQIAVAQGRSGLMPDTEVSRRRGWASGWLLARQSGLVHLAGRAAQDVGDHKPRSLWHRCRGIAPLQAVVII